MTYEQGSKPGEYIYDVFISEGVCICRKGLKAHFYSDGLFAKKKTDHLYPVQEKETGYKKMIVYKVIWIDQQIHILSLASMTLESLTLIFKEIFYGCRNPY